MNAIFFLIGCSVLVASLFLGAFLWAQSSGQNEDLYTPSVRILMDDEEAGLEKEPGDFNGLEAENYKSELTTGYSRKTSEKN